MSKKKAAKKTPKTPLDAESRIMQLASRAEGSDATAILTALAILAGELNQIGGEHSAMLIGVQNAIRDMDGSVTSSLDALGD